MAFYGFYVKIEGLLREFMDFGDGSLSHQRDEAIGPSLRTVGLRVHGKNLNDLKICDPFIR